MEDKDTAIVKDSPALNKVTKPVPAATPDIGINTDNSIADIIAAAGLTDKVDIGVINSFLQISQRRDELYKLFDTMGEDSTVAAIIETYAEDATEYNDKGQIIWCESSDSKVSQYVSFLLDAMQVDKNAYKWVYSLCKYGDLYLRLYKKSEYDKPDKFFDVDESKDSKILNEQININLYKESDHYVNYVEMVPNPAQVFELTRFGKTCGYIKTDLQTLSQTTSQLYQSTFRYSFKKDDVDIYNGDMFVHAALEDNTTRAPEEVKLFLDQTAFDKDDGTTYIVKRGQSLLYSTFKIWRILSLLENSMLLNRLTKSAIVRLINVEVGDMAKEMVGPHLQGIKQLMEQKSSINVGQSMQEYTNPGPIENNIYVPTYNGKGAISASQIGGDVNIGQLPDIDYFTNKFYGSMRVPKQYYGFTDDGAGFNGGQSLAIISSRYAKMIKRIQNTLCQALTDVVNLMLLDRGLDSYINKFTIRMQSPTTQEEIDRRDNESSKIQIVGDVMNLLSDIENPETKLKITKALLANTITDTEVIQLIQDEIDTLENSENPEENPEDNPGTGNEENISIDSSEPLDLDKELGLDTSNDLTVPEDNESEEIILPTPAELDSNIDFSDNSGEGI